jgi:uncharacterized protein YcbK (DUF882 family)
VAGLTRPLFSLIALLALVTPARAQARATEGAAPRSSRAVPAAAAPAASGNAKGARAARLPRPRTTVVELFNVNRHESLQLRLRDDHGRSVRGPQKRFDRFLRCHYTNTQHSMNPRLMTLLYNTGRHWPGHRLEVVSGYRHPTVAKNPRSPHMKGLACDFRVVGVSNTQLRDYLRAAYQKVGVGYYPNSSFVHLDVRKDRSAFWIDYSGPGERAIYSENPSQDLKTGRADSYHPTKIDEAWLNEMPPDDGKEPPPPSASSTPDDSTHNDPAVIDPRSNSQE